uniref:Large ribosomal subunit protein bL9c n=1 Tax=Ophidocladus simpliciusculus TaxID=1261574 RepID=A0A1Z1MJZ7_9FLOR|nr:ribosomal protein L9 [Ophidocladus simpliciusculus]ARW66074.1 ribosomal protein L9 [Ophidocladus simpliciusculus]
MKKKIKVILTKNHLDIKKHKSIINVAPGYAFNYLIPNNIAKMATIKNIKHFEMIEKLEKQKQEANIITINKLQNKVNQVKKIIIFKKKGENKLIFGSITEKDIINYIKKYTNIEINKKQIQIPAIRELGLNYINIETTNKIAVKIQLHVIPTNI